MLGSGGQIGASLFDYLHRAGLDAIPFDITRTPQEDLRRKDGVVEEAIANSDFVFFLAFDVGGSGYLAKFQNTFEFIHNNCLIMTNTFELLKKYERPFIFSSSQMSNMNYSNYGLLKGLGERYTAALNGLTVKFWNVYGVEADPAKTHVVTDFIAMASSARHIKMRTTGEERRQLLYSGDCAEGLLAVAKHYEDISRDKELHLTSFVWSSVFEIGQVIAEIFPGTTIAPGEATDNVQLGRVNDPNPFILEYWSPKTSLKDGIRRVAQDMGVI